MTQLALTVSHSEYLNYMYGNVGGYVTENRIQANGDFFFKERFFRTKELVKRQAFVGQKDVYMSMNSFLNYRKRNDEESGRKNNNLKRLNALYLDLDYYKLNLSKEDILEKLHNDYYNVKIPIPTFVIDSGRGMYLIWKIDEDRNALPRWKRVERYLYNMCECFGADNKALDAARILRVPSSINSKSKTTVSVIEFNDVKYTLQKIISRYNIHTEDRTPHKKAKGEVYPYGQATASQRKTALSLAKKMGVEAPNFEDYNETFRFIGENLKKIKQKIDFKGGLLSELKARVDDLFKLFAQRKGADCCRENALFLCRLWIGETTGDYAEALNVTQKLNQSFDVPFSDKYVEIRTRSAETKLKHGATYLYRRKSISRILKITEEEAKTLTYLKSANIKPQTKKEANRKAYLSKLQKHGKSTKKDEISKRREEILILIKSGKTKAEICEALKISTRTYERDVAEIKAKEIYAKVEQKIKKAVKKFSKKIKPPKIQSLYYKRKLSLPHGVSTVINLYRQNLMFCLSFLSTKKAHTVKKE